jgi:isocitrate dehydrogenase
MTKKSPPIIYTWTDEAPALATHALLPVIRAFAGAAGVPVETRDISLAGRVLALFPDRLDESRRVADDLAELGKLVDTPEANVIKLPNVSASIPQLKACIAELQAKGYALPQNPDPRPPIAAPCSPIKHCFAKSSTTAPPRATERARARSAVSASSFAATWPQDFPC